MGNEDFISDQQQIEEILSKANFIHLALADGDTPYIIPMSFGYKDNVIYLHGSKRGKKIDILKKNRKVCFEAMLEGEVIPTEDICKYDVKYRSVIGEGQAQILEDYNEKIVGLTVLSEHYGKKGPFDFTEEKVNRVSIIKIDVQRMTGKQHGFD